MSKKHTYEVKVEFVGYEYYEVKAESEDDAQARWAEGTLTGTDGHSYVPIAVTPYFEDDYEEDTDADDDY